MARSVGALLILLGVLCILAAFCLDAGREIQTGSEALPVC